MFGTLNTFIARKPLAFSLVEIVMALGIVSFAMMGIVGLLMVGMNTFRDSMDTTIQARIAQRIISDAQLTEFGKLSARQAFFDEGGREMDATDAQSIYSVDVALGQSTNSITRDFSTNVAKDLLVTIWNTRHPGEARTFSSVMVKND